MNKQIMFTIIGVASAVLIVVAVALLAQNVSHNTSIETPPADEAKDDVEYDYSQYSILKEMVAKLDSHGGSIISVDNRQYDFTTSYSFQLKDDLLLVVSPGANQLMVFHIHDIRVITVNTI